MAVFGLYNHNFYTVYIRTVFRVLNRYNNVNKLAPSQSHLYAKQSLLVFKNKPNGFTLLFS